MAGRRVYLAGPPYADEYRRRAAELAAARGWEPVDPMRRDFRGSTEGKEEQIVEGDLADIRACDAVLADFTRPDEGTAMERRGTRRARASRRRLHGRLAAASVDRLRRRLRAR